jgi:hypothetical protein
MISPQLALKLREAGLIWQPAKHDLFMIPNTGLAEQVFTLNDQTILVMKLHGEYAITFHGSTEWALDHVMLQDVIWLPSEAQLREAIQLRLGGEQPSLALRWNSSGYSCSIVDFEAEQHFDGESAADAYGTALLQLLRRATA